MYFIRVYLYGHFHICQLFVGSNCPLHVVQVLPTFISVLNAKLVMGFTWMSLGFSKNTFHIFTELNRWVTVVSLKLHNI